MVIRLHHFLLAAPSHLIVFFSLLLVAIVGAIDQAIDPELNFSIFYTIPISISAWYGGRRLGGMMSMLATVVWVAAGYSAGHQYSQPAALIWNIAARLGFFLIITYVLSHARSSVDALEMLAERDGLTGLINARTFKQRCDTIFALASRHDRPFALGYLDLDEFKSINDNFGHSVGDQVLRSVAIALKERLRTTDIASRLGGDEFAILLPETDMAGASKFFTELHEDMNDLAAANNWPIGFSIGVATYQHPVANADDAIGFADSLMYKVKKSGKNNILFEECP